MARISSPRPSVATHPGASSFDLSSTELGQLLARLQLTVLHADPEREQRLRHSEFERAKLEANLEYARSSLTKLEHDAPTVLAPGRRTEVQADLGRKRELLEILTDRMRDIHQMAVVDDDDDTSEGEDILAEIISTPSDSVVSTAAAKQSTGPADPETTTASPPSQHPSASPEPPTPAVPKLSTQNSPTWTDQSLRKRTSGPSTIPSYASARAALFANRSDPRAGPAAATTQTSTATAEAILDQQSAEREDLAGKVFQMAQAMKRQQQNIAASLETEKDVLSRATEGMERTGRGMEAAKGRMGALVRMTEGKGWWGRMMLYAWVYGLMVALMVLVFVMPKLRF